MYDIVTKPEETLYWASVATRHHWFIFKVKSCDFVTVEIYTSAFDDPRKPPRMYINIGLEGKTELRTNGNGLMAKADTPGAVAIFAS